MSLVAQINALAAALGSQVKAIKGTLNAATSAASASTLVARDANGRAQMADPSASADVATKNYVDGTTLVLASGALRPDSAPRSYIRSAAYTNLLTNPRGSSLGSYSTYRVNLHTNPTLDGNSASGWVAVGGATSFGYWASQPLSGTNCYTVTLDGAVGTGFYANVISGLVGGQTYSGRIFLANQSGSTVPLSVQMACFYSDGTSDFGTAYTFTTAAAGYNEAVPGPVTANAAKTLSAVRLYVTATGTASGVALRADNVIIEMASHCPSNFNGAVSNGTADFYSWNGNANASSSTYQMQSVRRNLCFDPTGATGSAWTVVNSGSTTSALAPSPTGYPTGCSGSYRQTFTSANTANIQTRYGSGLAAANYVSGGMLAGAGTPIVASAYVYTSYATTVTPSIQWMGFYQNTLSSTTGSPVSVPANTWTRVSVTGTGPVGTNSLIVGVGTGPNASAGDNFYVTGMLVEYGSVVDSFFTESSTASGQVTYSTPTAGSPAMGSAMQAANTPIGWQFSPNLGYYGRQVSDSTATFVRSLAATSAGPAWALYEERLGAAPGNQSYTVICRVRLNRSATITNQLRSGGTNYTGSTYNLTANTWTTIVERFLVPSTRGTTGNGRGVGFMQSWTAATGDLLDVQYAAVVQGIYDGPYFDGDNGPATWNGAAAASTSKVPANSMSYFDGVTDRWPVNASAVSLSGITGDATTTKTTPNGSGLIISTITNQPNALVALDGNAEINYSMLPRYTQYLSFDVTLTTTTWAGATTLFNWTPPSTGLYAVEGTLYCQSTSTTSYGATVGLYNNNSVGAITRLGTNSGQYQNLSYVPSTAAPIGPNAYSGTTTTGPYATQITGLLQLSSIQYSTAYQGFGATANVFKVLAGSNITFMKLG